MRRVKETPEPRKSACCPRLLPELLYESSAWPWSGCVSLTLTLPGLDRKDGITVRQAPHHSCTRGTCGDLCRSGPPRKVRASPAVDHSVDSHLHSLFYRAVRTGGRQSHSWRIHH